MDRPENGSHQSMSKYGLSIATTLQIIEPLSLNFVAQYSGADYQRKILIYLDICSVRGISNF